jgi:hypothetical protein
MRTRTLPLYSEGTFEYVVFANYKISYKLLSFNIYDE